MSSDLSRTDAGDRARPGPRAGGAGIGPGRILADRFEIRRELGAGGMGRVYEARDTVLGETVALKVVRPSVADDLASGRLLREVHLARQVTHSGICRVFDVFTHRGDPDAGEPAQLTFVSMERLDGETLRERLDRLGPLDPGEARRLLESMLDALDAAHRAGIVHRDLKPSNVFLCRDGRVVLADFGLALETRESDREQRLTRSGSVIGSPAYMAPEQVADGDIGPGADLFALGVLLFEMLTGTLPFSAPSSAATMVKRLHEAAPRPSSVRPDLAPDWDAIVAGCLQRSPADRFGSVAEVRAALAPGLRDDRLHRSRTGAIGLGAGLLVLVLASLLAIAELRDAAPSDPAPAPRTVAVAEISPLGPNAESWIGTALREMLRTELDASPDLRVLGATDREVGAPPEDPAALRRRSGADVVVSGHYAQLPDGRLRVDLEAADGSTRTRSASEGSVEDLFELAERAGAGLLGELGLQEATATAERRAAFSTSPRANRLWANGLEALRRQDAPRARDVLLEAAAEEGDHPLIRAALARAWGDLGYDDRALAEARRANELARDLPREQALRVEVEYRVAARELDRAITLQRSLLALAPEDVERGVRLVELLVAADRTDDAETTWAAFSDAAPDDPRIPLARARIAEARDDFRGQLAAADAAAARARTNGAEHLLAAADLEACRASSRLGELAAARGRCEASRTAAADADDLRGIASAIGEIGVLDYQRGDVDAAADAFRESLTLFRRLGDVRGQAAAANRLAGMLYLRGETEEAERLFRLAEERHREIGDLGGAAKALSNLANLIRDRGDLEEARGLYLESIALKRERADRGGIAYTLHNLAELEDRAGDPTAAFRRLDEALGILEEIGDRNAVATTLRIRGEMHVRHGAPDRARADLERAADLADGLGNAELAGQIRARLAGLG